jgi:hypothetical protein
MPPRALPTEPATPTSSPGSQPSTGSDVGKNPTLPPIGPEIGLLGRDEGEWEVTVEVRATKDAPPSISHGHSTSRMGCGGRWLISDYRADSGFEGHGVYGFDPAKGKYVGVWFDPTRTFVGVLEGTYDEASRAMTMRASGMVASGFEITWREITERPDDDTRIFRSLMPDGEGGEREVMTATYRRKRA